MRGVLVSFEVFVVDEFVGLVVVFEWLVFFVVVQVVCGIERIECVFWEVVGVDCFDLYFECAFLFEY